MSETMTAKAHEYKEKKDKYKKPKDKYKDEDGDVGASCCTPPGGGGTGADTKP
jgi:hypothetical protein